MTESIHDPGTPAAGERDGKPVEGPDPVIGAGLTLLGIFVMGTGGARDAHYVFDLGVLTGVLGAATFVLCVALSAMKQRQAETEEDEQDPSHDEAESGPTPRTAEGHSEG